MTDSGTISATEIRNRNDAEELLIKLLTNTPNEHLLQFIPDTGVIAVLSGKDVVGGIINEVEILRGRTLEDKPLVRHFKTKRRYKGSGRYGPPPQSTLGDENDREYPLTPTLRQQTILDRTAKNYRETASYREAFEALLPADADVSARGSLAWWFDQAWEAAEGSPQTIECPHPELHQTGKSHASKPVKHIVAFKKEANLIFKMIELAVGKAQATTNININEKKLVESLEHRVIEVKLQSLDSRGVDNRIKMISEMGYISPDESSPSEMGYIPAEVLDEEVLA